MASGERGKRTVKLWEAYQIAAQEHDLDHFKTMLKNHEEQVIQEAQAQAERDAAKKEKEAEKAARKEARKSKGDAEDVEMGNTEESAKKKKTPSKKRKEPADGEVEDDQKVSLPARTHLLESMYLIVRARQRVRRRSRSRQSRQMMLTLNLQRKRRKRSPRRRRTRLLQSPLSQNLQSSRSWIRRKRTVSCYVDRH